MDINDLRQQMASVTGGKTDQLIGAVGRMISDSDGVAGLAAKLNESGLGRQVDSWIGTRQNESVDEDQLADAVGNDQVRQVAQGAGVSEEQARTGLAAALPQLINELTPDGYISTSDERTALESLRAMVEM
jgi:uncharacterized protein YidB (DUF937 family)